MLRRSSFVGKFRHEPSVDYSLYFPASSRDTVIWAAKIFSLTRNVLKNAPTYDLNTSGLKQRTGHLKTKNVLSSVHGAVVALRIFF